MCRVDVERVNTRAKWSNDRRKSDGTGRLHAVGFRRIAPIQFRRRRRARGCARMLSPFQFFFFFSLLDSGVLSSQKFQIHIPTLSLFLPPIFSLTLIAPVSLEDTLPIQEDVTVGIVPFRK